MTVTTWLTSKQYIKVEGTSDAEGIWRQILRGDPIETGRYNDKTIVNPDNVTSVMAGR